MTTKLISLFALCVLLGLVMLACGGGADNANTAVTNTNTAGNKNATATASPAANTSGTTASTGDKIGVAECDEYIAKYEACLNGKVPEAARAAYKTSFETMRTTWKKAAETPQGKAALAQGCKTALEQAKTAFGSYGCTW
jgi:hypothetical protein